MQEIVLTIEHDEGLHARPAQLFVRTAQKFKSDIFIECHQKRANAKSVLSILTLGVNKGTKIKVLAKGEDAGQSLQALAALVASNFSTEDSGI